MQSLADIEAWLGQPMPRQYISFLPDTAESFLATNDRTLVYGRDSIVERNTTYQSHSYCPGHLMVGDDSGGAALIMSLEDERVYSVGMGAMTPDCFELVAPNFETWQAAGYSFAE